MEPKSRKKGNYLKHYFPNDYVLLDIETTGLNPTFNRIIEIAIIRIRNGEVVDSYETLINPGFRISSFIENFTGISNEMLQGKPSICEVITDIYDFIGNDIIVGHNVNFDINFIYDNCMMYLAKELSNDYVDTLYLAKHIFPSLSSHSLTCISNHLDLCPPAHRAMDDVKSTYACLKHMHNYVLTHNITMNPKKHLEKYIENRYLQPK